jgi:nicotinamidase-related amidase
MPDLSGKLKSAIHLCVDMQRLFASEGPWPTLWMERVLPKVVQLVETSPARTVFTRFVPPDTAKEAPGMWQAYYRKWNGVTRSHR